ncbi:DNA-binding response regulator [Subtercola sp. Z020]|uniref:response regulator n=1 Tax=Subtercola sp. Z020 TaxID=2080582 RepID=UPI000CE773C2|nr:response regulator transcription factor [Subtercola sp. Z020]PPF78909.1 DNA-binding response regulator [Subtercola sp. Z020]
MLVVDDHPLVRGGLISLLSSTPDLAVVGEAGGGLDAVRMAAELAPDVTLIDLSMPDIGGAEATRRILAARPDANIVVLTSFHDHVRVREALEAGAIGFLLKDAEPAVLLSAVRAAARGDAPLDPRVARALLPRAASPVPTAGPGPGPALSTREAEVLRLLTRGMSNKQIGTHLGIAERTVKAHVGSIFRHLGVADRTSAALWARDNRF